MAKKHRNLVEVAKKAIQAVADDKSVDPEDAIQSMEDLSSEIDCIIDGLNSDIETSLEGIE